MTRQILRLGATDVHPAVSLWPIRAMGVCSLIKAYFKILKDYLDEIFYIPPRLVNLGS